MPIGFNQPQGRIAGPGVRSGIIRPEWRDRYRRYVSDNPSPEKFAALLRNSETDIGSLCELQEEIEAKNGHVRGIATTRRQAFCGLEWDIEADPEAENQVLAGVIAKRIKEDLKRVQVVYPQSGLKPGGFRDALRFLATAIGPNLSAMELVWGFNGTLVEMRPVPGHRLTVEPLTYRLAVEIDEQSTGLPLDEFPDKFVVHCPDTRGGFPTRSTITHASAWLYLVAHFSRVDWMAFSETYGTPWRIGKYADADPDIDRDTFKTMLEKLGPDVAAIIPAGWDVEAKTVTGNGETYEKQLAWCESQLSILWLGQTLTTNIGNVGSRAAAEVHDNVRKDLLAGDLADEAEMVRKQIIAPMVRLAFPNIPDVPLPIFRRKLNERKDSEASRIRMDQIRLAREMGLSITADEVYEALNITRPPQQEEELIGQDTSGRDVTYPVIAQIKAAAELGLPVDLDEVYRKLNLTKPVGNGTILTPISSSQADPNDPNADQEENLTGDSEAQA